MIRAKRGVFERADDVISFQAGEIIKHSGCAAAPIPADQMSAAGGSRHAPKRGDSRFDPEAEVGWGQNAVRHNAAFPRLRGLFGKQRALALDAPAIA